MLADGFRSVVLGLASVALLGSAALSVPAQDGGGKAGPGRGDRRGMRPEQGAGVAVGSDAPDFTLKTVDGKVRWRLSAFEGKQPVGLIFGSYT